MRLLIIRHADPDYPNNTITPAGHLEAQALARHLKRDGLDRIYCSPLGRAVDTARYTAQALGITPTIEEWTAELGQCRLEVPPWGMLCVWDIPGEILRARQPMPTADNWPSIPQLSDLAVSAAYKMVQENSDRFLARHGYVRQEGRYCIQQPNREKIAIFCHGGFGLWWLAHLLEIPLPLMFSGFFLPPSSITTVLLDERSTHWATPRCIGLGDISHLRQANLPMQPSGIKANLY